MLKGIGALVSVSLAGWAWGAAAQTAPYAVNEFVLGGTVAQNNAQYRDYRCGPSEQFEGFTWCQKSRQGGMRRQAFNVSQSLLHSRDGKIAYINRQQDPVTFESGDADEDIRTFSRKLSAQPRITKLPRRGGLEGTLAIWGQVSIEPLDADGLRVLADGRSPKRGFLVDYVGNLFRSAQEGLPVYRITGGPGLIWVASYDQRGRGTLRVTAVDVSMLAPAAPPVAEAAPPKPVADSAPTVTTAENKPTKLAAESQPAPPAAAPASPTARTRTEIVAVTDDKAALPRAEAPVVPAEVQAQAKVDQARFEPPAAAAPAPTGAEAEIARLKSATRTAYAIVAGLVAVLFAIAWLAVKRRKRAREAALAAEKAKLRNLAAVAPAAFASAAEASKAPSQNEAKTIEGGIFSIVHDTFDQPAPTVPAMAAAGNGQAEGKAAAANTNGAAASAPVSPAGLDAAALSIVPADVPEHAVTGEATPAADGDPVGRLVELAKLRASGLLTESEFAQLKANLIAATARESAPSTGSPPPSAV